MATQAPHHDTQAIIEQGVASPQSVPRSIPQSPGMGQNMSSDTRSKNRYSVELENLVGIAGERVSGDVGQMQTIISDAGRLDPGVQSAHQRSFNPRSHPL